MVDHPQDKRSPFAGYVGDIVLPDLPPSAEALLTQMAQRLFLRRWLLILCISVILTFVLVNHLPLLPAMLGIVSIVAGGALLPREGVMRPVGLDLRPLGLPANQAVSGLLEGLPAPAVVLSAQGQVLAFNRLARDFFPQIRSNVHLSTVLRDPGVLDAVSAATTGARQSQLVQYEERVPIERHLEVAISWIGPAKRRSESRGPAILVYLRDLTEQERMDRLRTDFIANASHELRTPLASVLGFIETLQGAARNDPAAREHFLDIMAGQAKRMARLIDNLLSLSRIEMRLHLRPNQQVDLAEVAQHVVTALEPVAETAGITFHFDTEGEPAWVLGDWDELVQVVSNLAENAIKYGRGSGNIWIKVERPPQTPAGKVAISVRDDGPGVEEKHLPRLTERFYRANDAGGEKSGTGLGLAIVKHVVTRHRGELKIVSRLGEGSVFSIVLDEAPALPN